MKKIVIVPNAARDEDYIYTKKLVGIIGGRAEVFMSERHKSSGIKAEYVPDEELFLGCECIVTLGGDGTILSAASMAVRFDIPILGINLGRLGFLAEVERDSMEDAARKLLSGDYSIEKRKMIQAEIFREGKCVETFHALNDIVVSRASFSRLLSLKTFIDKKPLSSFVADGVILSTPTGSTAYSLSAGGPVVDPSLDAMLLTPVCPHRMNTRPMVLPLSSVVSVQIEDEHETQVFVSADGARGIKLEEGDIVRATKSGYTTKLIKINDQTFYDTVRKKLERE